MANALRLKGDPQLESTKEFIEQINCMFDILNVRHKEEGKHSRNPNKDPYTSQSDRRFEVSTILCDKCIIVTDLCTSIRKEVVHWNQTIVWLAIVGAL